MNCVRCGRPIPAGAVACPSCGQVNSTHKRRRTSAEPVINQPAYQRRKASDESTVTPKDLGKGLAGHLGIPKELRHGSEESGRIRIVRHTAKHENRRIDAVPVERKPAIYRNTHKRLKQALLLVLLFTVAVISVTAYSLLGTENGQQLMAGWGWDIAHTDAYVTLGKSYLDQAYYTRALELLSVATEREPENVDALVYMAQAYSELKEEDKAVAIYESLITRIAPSHPSAYRNLIRIYEQRGLTAEALALMKKAAENTGTQEFSIMLREYTPTTPSFSKQAGRYNEAIDVVISTPEGETVYYTTDGTDPSEAGQVYQKGTVIHIPEGKMTVKAIGFTDTGVPSEQIEANYTVIIPTPAAPKANYASGKYKKAPKVSLRPGDEDAKKNKEIVAIYYTLDGRQATVDSTLYTGPIQLPVGDCELRAIAVAQNGKISYEMRVTYSVEGNLKKKYTTDDTFKNLGLFKTTYTSFIKTYGMPESYDLLPQDEWYSPDMQSYTAVYAWGTARFAAKNEKAAPVLYALNTSNAKMTGPRSTRVGMKGSEVMNKFQDLGHPALDDDGNRLLYNLNSGGYMFGTYRKEPDGTYAIHYYTPVDDKHSIFLELSYYLDVNGIVSRIVWQRYLSETKVGTS